MFTVQYACLYRPIWYDMQDGDNLDWYTAVSSCQALHLTTGRVCRVVDSAGSVHYQLPR